MSQRKPPQEQIDYILNLFKSNQIQQAPKNENENGSSTYQSETLKTERSHRPIDLNFFCSTSKLSAIKPLLAELMKDKQPDDLLYTTRNGTPCTPNNFRLRHLNPLKKKTVYIVLKELMTNNRKHSKSNFALISFTQNGNKLHIAYKDNGIGGDLKKNNGLQNLEYRIKALKGKIDFDSEKGKGFKVDILL